MKRQLPDPELIRRQAAAAETKYQLAAPPIPDLPEPVAPVLTPGTRRLSDCTADELRALEVRLYWGRHVYRRDDLTLSSQLNVRMDELNDLANLNRR